MSIEHDRIPFVSRTAYDDLKSRVFDTLKNPLMTVLCRTLTPTP